MTTVQEQEELVEIEALAEPDPRTIVLRSGQRLQIQGVPYGAIQHLDSAFTDPPPPMVEVEIDGQKTLEPNANDPDWQAICAKRRIAKNVRSIDLALLKGVLLDVPEDEGWLEDLDALGIDRPDVSTRSRRKLAYLQLEVLRSMDDMSRVVQAVYALTMPSEDGIAAAAARFPRTVPRR